MKQLSKNPKNVYMREYRKKHVVSERRKSRVAAKKFREANKEDQKKYHSEYFAKWLENPVNNKCHMVRSKTSYIANQLRKKGDAGKYQYIVKNLYDVGWSEYMSDIYCLNHIVSLTHIFTFRIDIPLYVIFDKLNIEVMTRVENNLARNRTVNSKMLRVVHALEKKYPEELKGFCDYLKTKKGELK